MSQLIDRLNRVAAAVPEPMGFRRAQPVSPKPQMLLIASLAQAEDFDRLTEHVAGADAVMLHFAESSLADKAIPKSVQSLPDTPWGGWLDSISEKTIERVTEIGGDFVVFPASGNVLETPQGDKPGRILQVESSLSEGLIRAINELPVDAALTVIPPEEEPLTWHHLMLLQRFADLLTKPLLVAVPPKVTARELEVLWTTGVDGVVIEVGSGHPVGRLKELHEALDSLTPLPPRKRRKMEALLPRISEDTGIVPDSEEEDE